MLSTFNHASSSSEVKREFDDQKFIEDFLKLPLNLIHSTDDIDEKLDLFNSMFASCLDIHAPLRKN